MKQTLFFSFFVVILITFAACQKSNSVLTQLPDVQQVTSRNMVTTTGSPYFTARLASVDHETFVFTDPIDPAGSADCVSPAYDCAVIAISTILGDQLLEEFDGRITNGQGAELYSTGHGNDVTTLNAATYQKVVDGELEFVKYVRNGRNLYILQ